MDGLIGSSPEQFFNGHITISIVNPLTNFSPSSPDSNSVDVLVYQHWENLSFYKPVVEQLPIQVQNRWKDLSHTDGGDTTSKLSVLSSNSICPVGIHQPFAQSDLSIASICAIPQLIYSRAVTTSTP